MKFLFKISAIEFLYLLHLLQHNTLDFSKSKIKKKINSIAIIRIDRPKLLKYIPETFN